MSAGQRLLVKAACTCLVPTCPGGGALEATKPVKAQGHCRAGAGVLGVMHVVAIIRTRPSALVGLDAIPIKIAAELSASPCCNPARARYLQRAARYCVVEQASGNHFMN
jgi:hypothetical protein